MALYRHFLSKKATHEPVTGPLYYYYSSFVDSFFLLLGIAVMAAVVVEGKCVFSFVCAVCAGIWHGKG